MKKILIPVLVVLLVVFACATVYFYWQVSNLTKDPDASMRKEVEDLVAVVGKLIILPQDEVPTIATVSDPAKLAGQAFFAKAKVGDKVLLFQNARKAYLYDPVANRILEVAPINLDGTTADPQEALVTGENQVPSSIEPAP